MHKDLDSISDTTENTQVLLSLLSRIDISFFFILPVVSKITTLTEFLNPYFFLLST